MCRIKTLLFLCLAVQTAGLSQSIPKKIAVSPRVSTGSVKNDADDPAIWIHPTEPAKSMVIGTDKANGAPGLYVWDMQGKQIQFVPVENPNNVDVRYDINLGGTQVDVVVTNSRPLKELKVYAVDRRSGALADVTTDGGISIADVDVPYGLALYRRPNDGALFAILTSKSGNKANLHQYRLRDDGKGKIKGEFIGSFGNNAIKSIAEGLAVDDELGYVYASDETKAIRKFYADRDGGNDTEITAFGTDDGFSADREGISIYKCTEGTGYLLVSNQGSSTVNVYAREGDNGDPTRHSLLTTIDTKNSKETDGLDVSSRPAGPTFPLGFLVTHDSPGKRFNLYAWEDIAGNYMHICPEPDKPSAVTEIPNGPPADFSLAQNYPNPFNPETQITFTVHRPGRISLLLFDIRGSKVRVLIDRSMATGTYSVRWDGLDDAGRPAPSGAYLYRLSNGRRILTRKLVLMR